ncbi:helix-turn-helix domain-containing protein [Rhizobium redzepovicii]|uniref:helix-turn-helix domain-containing protein n=1 Tax=Rhizobium redzepovicii TaxID=2867518 RepID=UPI002872194E|nr:helix-turn-helix transcriptional regulator [Rhizobium redzepovicii]MDR9781608.1 helix-turn-helix transcriptional regulator [Rhizobium redzepovicii]
MSYNELAAMRKELGLTQADMADRMGVPFRTYQDLEAGKSAVRPIHLKAAAYARKLERKEIDDDDVMIVHPFHVGPDGMLDDEPAVRVYGNDIETTARHFFGDDIAFGTGSLSNVRGSIALVRGGKVDKRMVYKS